MTTTPLPPPAKAMPEPPAASQAMPPGRLRRTLIGAGIGNALEWYDWHIYGIFSAFFAKQFFKPGNEVSALLSTLAIFAVGFAMRPVGGFVFGWIADRKGRRLAMMASITLGAVGSMAIGIAPTYAAVGVVAPLTLLLARFAQGLAHGGELPSAMTYLAETAPAERRGRWTSVVFLSGACGILVATILGAVLAEVLGKQGLAHWGWRVPFIIGGLLGFYALILRRRLAESHQFEQERVAENFTKRPSVWRGIWQNRAAAGRVVALAAAAAVVYQTWTVTAPAYAIGVQHLNATRVLVAEVIALLVFIAALPLCGALSDRIGRRPAMVIFGLSMAVLSYPLTALARSGAVWQFGLAMTIALLPIALCVAILPAIFAELFPTRVRATATGMPYAVGVALCGGTAPYLLVWLKSHNLGSYFTGYSIALVLIGVLVMVLGPETRGKTLE